MSKGNLTGFTMPYATVAMFPFFTVDGYDASVGDATRPRPGTVKQRFCSAVSSRFTSTALSHHLHLAPSLRRAPLEVMSVIEDRILGHLSGRPQV